MVSSENNKSYFETAHTQVLHRSLVWVELVKFLTGKLGDTQPLVVDLGAGYCDFINLFPGQKKYAVDLNPKLADFTAPGVHAEVRSVTDLSFLLNNSVDLIFASNLLEHLEWLQLDRLTDEITRVLRPGGRAVFLQPNFYYSYREYFHDYTHRTPFTHIGLAEYLQSKGLKIFLSIPRFVPISMQSKYGGPSLSWLPHWLMRRLISLYLRLPYRPFAKQMLVVVEKT